jgi:protoheme IX farnesyltransferase
MKDYVELTKPRITWLILMSTGIGFYFGLGNPHALNWWTLLHTIVGTGLIASGTAALNQWYEREADAKMKRTRARPLPSGRVTSRGALAFGAILSIAGFVELWLGANLLAALLGAFTLVTYLCLYTPLKQRSKHSTTVGAIPGAMPPLIGFAAAAGTLTAEPGFFTPSSSFGSSRTFMPSPGCTATITREPESACCRLLSQTVNRLLARWSSMPSRWSP